MTAAACPSLQGTDALGLSQALASVDCQVGAAVAQSYARLFGTGGLFAAVLTALLTVYVAVIGYGLITGRGGLSLAGLAPKVVTIGLVLTLATSWPAYETLVTGLLVNGPDQIASNLSGDSGHAGAAFAERLDGLFDRFADLAKTIGDDKTAGGGPVNAHVAAILVWVSALILLLGTAGALVLTRIVLAVLLAVGPVFVVFALFRPTRGLFDGWLRTACLFALAPMLTVLAGSGALALLEPLLDAIADDPQGAVSQVRPIVELFLGAMVYAGLMAMLVWAAASLVRSWRPLSGRSAPRGGSAQRFDAVPAAGCASAASFAPGVAGSVRPQAAPAPRIDGVVAALLREDRAGAAASGASAARIAAMTPSVIVQAPAGSGGGDARRRAQGLGQSFRGPTASTAPIAGAIGS